MKGFITQTLLYQSLASPGMKYFSEIFNWYTKQSKTRVIWKTSYNISTFMWSKSQEFTSSYGLKKYLFRERCSDHSYY